MPTESGVDLLLSIDHTRNAVVLTVSGELDATTAHALEHELDHVDIGKGLLVLDLTGVTFCDSVGLASVLEAERPGVDLRVVGSRQVRKTVALTGMDAVIHLFGSVPEATRLLADEGDLALSN
ncbi:STAS domain-containing protein [Umezawaea sp. Da 62-37]|uniref:STAS domain-containing protein n=1 Tax=Umezawaea sp. Da 62-37 TaxID=3075927 RepID=UPI0028F73DF1|nr:STAS domain-containing protein [Umezawaea sp. Da 62-37]WNV92171.1 STAS domain-containing protein [Umezawaea sp. Da 62-37]